ncbi:MAG: hypothetical protein HC886_21600 [Leptolyngbyaceae cyanobacterium SM1_1_3]|nr:hypothetical protein [Leptolyngbyaceae cyanobacterium SM1_1_3]NJN01007.1 hypothetical protein [Leptolyngbyaceae cyanobacterium RM1_1_2]NJO11740.1 hypothetical protein [Leptolyngbyaceae cyanobacterium SL_1_1]
MFRLQKLALSAASIAALGVSGLFAQQASAQTLPTLLVDCDANTAEFGCLNGQGASFAFEFANGIFPDFFPGLYNYASRGSSSGRNSFLAQNSIDGSVPRPYIYAFSEAPVTATQATQYANSLQRAGFGRLVQLPLIGGYVTLAYNSQTGVTTGVDLEREEFCALFNGTPNATVGGSSISIPAGLRNATGIRRADGSGTTFIISTALDAQCGSIAADIDGDGVQRSGETLWSYEVGTSNTFRSRGAGAASVADSTCTASGAPNDTVCWPSAFQAEPQNQGIANVMAANATAQFGYLSGSALNLASTLRAADLENAAGAFVAPNPANASDATAQGSLVTPDPANICRTELVVANPSAGYPIVGFSYLLAYGDYTPDRTTTGAVSPAAGAFGNRGDFYRNSLTTLVAQTAVSNNSLRNAASALDYVVLGQPLGGQIAGRALQCITSVTGS